MSDNKPRILLADDSIDMQVLFKLLLRNEDIQLEVVDNGKSALERVKSLGRGESYDSIFMDLNMPEMDGDEATCLIREWELLNKRLPHRIILLSASKSEQMLDLLDKGFDSFIQKPVNRDKILNEVSKSRALKVK